MMTDDQIAEFRRVTSLNEFTRFIIDTFGFESASLVNPTRSLQPPPETRVRAWSADPVSEPQQGWSATLVLSGPSDGFWDKMRAFTDRRISPSGYVLGYCQGADTGRGDIRRLTYHFWINAEMFSAMWLAEKLREGLDAPSDEH